MVDETDRFTGCDIVRRSNLCETYHMRNSVPFPFRKFEEFVMKFASSAIAIALLAATTAAIPAIAETNLFTSEPSATAACGADEVVWVDLDHGRFYHKASANFAKGSNGGFACLKAAHAQYREGHE